MKKKWMMWGCVVLLLSGCGSRTADELYEKGVEALEQTDYTKAVDTFLELTEMGERLPEAYRGTGIAWLEQEAYPEAIAAFSRSLNAMEYSNWTFEKDVTCYLAQARLSYGETEKAIQLYSEILRKEKDTQVFYLRGKAYLIQGDLDKAEADFNSALDDCTSYQPYMHIYQICVSAGYTKEGSEYLNRALELSPRSGEDYYQMAGIYYIQENYQEAADSLRHAIDQEYPEAMLFLGKVYLKLGDSASARSMCQEYLNQGSSPAGAYCGLALCDLYDGQYENALEDIRQGLECASQEEKQELLYNEIVAYEYLRDFATAKEKMAEYVELYPDDQDGTRENQFLSTRS